MDLSRRILVATLILLTSKVEAVITCARWFRNGNVLERPQRNNFVNVPFLVAPDLHSQFVQLFVEGSRSQILDQHGIPAVEQNTVFLETLVSRTDLTDKALGSSVSRVIDTLATMADVKKIASRDFDESFARRWLKNVLAYLYERYQRQGPERHLNVEKYQAEDILAARRTTHFTLLVNGEVLSHLQAMSSLHLDQLLNFERHFGRSTDRQEEELVFELGRLESVKWHKLTKKTRSALEAAGYTREIVLLLTYQKALAWLNADVNAQKVFFQVNEAMFEVLSRLVAPMNFDSIRQVQDTPTSPKEYIVKVNTSQLKVIEDALTQRIIRHFFQRDFEKMRRADFPVGWTWNWIYWPNETSSTNRLNFGSAGRPFYINESPPLDSIDSFWAWLAKQVIPQQGVPTSPGPHALALTLNRFQAQEYYLIATEAMPSLFPLEK